MPLIHILEKQTDTILDDITADNILDNEHYRSLKDTVETFEFTTFADKRFSPHLEKRNRVIIPDEDRGYMEFIITNSIKIHEQGNLVETEVYADASYLELKKSNVIEPQTLTEYTVSQHAGFALNGTAWQVGRVESSNYRTMTIETHTNPYNYLKRVANEFDLELNFRVEIQGNRIVGRYVDLVESIGQWRGIEVEFGRNLDGIRRNESTQDVVTALIGLGPEPMEDEDGNTPPRLEVYLEDNEALERWGFRDRNGELKHLVEHYEPQSDRQDMTYEELLQYTRTELNKRVSEVVEYEANIHDLEHVPGLKNYELRFGDTIRIKDTKFNPPLYLEARIHSQKRDIKNKEHKRVTLGDYTEFTEEEVTAIWRQLQREIQRKISMYELLEYTYDKETIDDKDRIVFGDGQEYSRNVASEAENNAKDHADYVAGEAERIAKEYADTEIGKSKSSILEQVVAQAIFDTTVAEIYEQLLGKVDNEVVSDLEEMVEGRLDNLYNITGDLKQSIIAHADELEAHDGRITKVVNELDEVAGTLNLALTDLSNLSDTVSQQGTQIQANTTKIGLKANQADLDLVTGKISSIEAELIVQADAIASKVEQTEFDAETNALSSAISSVEQTAQGIIQDVRSLQANLDDLEGEIVSHNTRIEQNARDILARATIQSVNELTGNVKDLEAELVVQAGLIATKVEETTFNNVTGTLGNRLSTVEQTAEGLVVDVSSVRADLDGINEELNGIGDTLSSHNTRIEQNATQISLKANQTEVDTLTQDVSRMQTEISANAEAILLRATRTEVDGLARTVNSIESEILVMAGQISSKVDDGDVRSIFTQEARSFTFEADQINFDGHVFGGDATFNGRIEGAEIVGSTIVQEDTARRITLNNMGIDIRSKNNNTGLAIFGSMPYEGTTAGSGSIIGFYDMVGSTRHWGATIEHALGEVLEIVGGGVRILQNDRGSLLNPALSIDGGDLIIRNGAGRVIANYLNMTQSANTAGYLGVTARLRITDGNFWQGSTSATNFRPVNASSFDTISLADAKQDITILDKSGLDIISSAQLYKYRLKSEVEQGIDFERYGLVIGEGYKTPSEVINDNGEAIAQYEMTTFAWKAIQELLVLYKDLESDINWLEMENNLLKNRVEKLERMIA